MSETHVAHGRTIAVIGLGYVGLPVAVAFARSGTTVIGYDIDPERVRQLRCGHAIKKVVASQEAKSLDMIAAVYGSVVTAGIHKAPSIKVAEAAKVIENTQRDLNIALMNEFSAICHLLGIDTIDALEAAAAKWNFLRFTPGLVGGHCIGVDPYYLTHRAEKAGYHPEIILAGRRINDGVGRRVARQCLRYLMRTGSSKGVVTVLGLTFKENVPDVRNSKVADIISELQSFGATVQIHDPMAAAADVWDEYGIDLQDRASMSLADALVLAVPHKEYIESGWDCIVPLLKDSRGLVIDVKARLDRTRKPDGVELWRL
jgi:UDP-N-acetyl-D-galactosamine dehydrogenase